MTTVQDILTFMEGLAPYELAESWDNVGLLCGDRAQEVTSVLCALDVTETVVQEAAERGAQLVVAHHPAIFTSVSRVTSDDTTGRVLRYAIKHDISIICMHTNADCAEGGVNDALASALFLTNVVSMEAGENGSLSADRTQAQSGAVVTLTVTPEKGYRLEKLEAMTAVCSVGLDMIAVPGDTDEAVISGIIADEMTGATSREGVFAGGDAVTGAATVILAMGAGKNAAAAMDAYMQGKN